jgi:hypothetical protein
MDEPRNEAVWFQLLLFLQSPGFESWAGARLS